MKNGKNILLIAIMTLVVVAAAGCQKKQPENVNPTDQTIQNTSQPDDKGIKDKKSIIEISKPKTDLEQVEEIVKNKGDVVSAVTLYKSLMQKLPKGDPARQKLLDYIMAESLTMVQSKDRQKIQIGLDAALALNDIEAGNYYVQNRIIYAYTNFAKMERAAGNLDKAQEYTEKALIYHFAGETMRLRLEILMDKAKQDIAAKKYADARALLNEIVDIGSMSENGGIYKEENAQAKALLDTIKGL